MVSLNLHAPPRAEAGTAMDAKRRAEWLDAVAAVLERVQGKEEARMWLIAALASLPVPPLVQVSCFLDLLQNSMREHGKSSGALELQFARMLCENRPRLAATLIATDSTTFRRLFAGHPKRILLWFDSFGGVGQSEHQRGARALANYAFRNRDLCWHLLEWKGKHAQAPSTVAAKPHYFLELDVVNTVLNLLEDEPEFWRSEEFRDSLRDGEFLSIDVTFFAEVLVAKLASDVDSALGTWKVLQEFLREASFSSLCLRLLHVASDQRLLRFINDLSSDLSHERRVQATTWLEVVVRAGLQWRSLMQPVFCNACIRHGRSLWRMLQDEEHEEDANSLKKLMKECSGDETREHWALRDEGLRMDAPAACRYLALEAWVLFYRLSSEGGSYERLLEESGVQFRHHSSAMEKGKNSDKHSRKRKHRRRDSSEEEDESDGGVKEEQGWRLSVDGYSLTWTKADLAEYLTGFAVQRWLEWLVKA